MVKKIINIDEICKYGYYDEIGNKVLVLDEEKIKQILQAKEIRVE